MVGGLIYLILHGGGREQQFFFKASAGKFNRIRIPHWKDFPVPSKIESCYKWDRHGDIRGKCNA